MSKSVLKKHLQTLTKEEITEIVLVMYDNLKPAKEYLEYYLNPNEQEMLEKYKAIITKEFGPVFRMSSKLRFSVAKKAIAEFRALNPSPESLADLMVTLPEAACKFTHDYGDMSEQFYDSAYNNYAAALKYLHKNKLLDRFKNRCDECVKNSKHCGYAFEDGMKGLFEEYYPDSSSQ